MLKVSNIFGPTVQGEGSAAGQHCLFVRLSGCNLECTWCDTPETWAFTEQKASKHRELKVYAKDDPKLGEKLMTGLEVHTQLRKLWDVQTKPTLVVISGGEPLMQQRDDEFNQLLRFIKSDGNRVHIETAGTLSPTTLTNQYVDQYNVSPKLSSSGNRISKRYRPGVISSFLDTEKAWFKFVVANDADFFEVDDVVESLKIPANRVMIMPEGTTAQRNIEVVKKYAESAVRKGWGVSFRTHVLIWGNDPDW
ncbi:7-carboxy-7-deazaguanine synthase QueE [Streptomyces sp. CoH17]|uniref:7-carboxy-7-deazaguanine synthase QueE n=1 Tax=Streptomyces sp. CoH17 TaxID=2992806 RepID=UPI00226E7B4A|nr:7-carboxy-7-deazaguanine synthase QueE [Streptomyces sp. CoH17]